MVLILMINIQMSRVIWIIVSVISLLMGHLRHLTHDGRHLRDVIGVGKSGDQRLHNTKGEDNDRQDCLCRQCAVHIEKAAHRQDAEKCRREYRHSGHLPEEAAPHPVDEAVCPCLCGGNELCVSGLRCV